MSDQLDQLVAWFEAQGMRLVLAEIVGHGTAHAYVYGGQPTTLRGIVIGDSLVDALENAKAAVESGSVRPGPPQPVGLHSGVEESLSMDVATIAGTELRVRLDNREPVVKPPPPEMLETHLRVLKWQRQDDQDKVWMVQAFDGSENLLGIGMGDNEEDALLDLADALLPPKPW